MVQRAKKKSPKKTPAKKATVQRAKKKSPKKTPAKKVAKKKKARVRKRANGSVFIDKYTQPVVIELTTSRELDDFADIREFLEAFDELERCTHKAFMVDYFGSDSRHRRFVKQKPQMVSLRAGCPAILAIFADPAWLALIIGSSLSFIVGYDQIKKNTPEIRDDFKALARSAIRKIRGISRYPRRALIEAVDVLCFEYAERNLELFEALYRFGESVISEDDEIPKGKVMSFDTED